jgi:uncharacterized membrane-anchored protein YjiN (DUF445 family)
MTEEGKRAQLGRMKRVALVVVAAMLALYFASTVLQPYASWLHWVRAFSEAGVAGAMADWYAVVALFKRPLALPIPHTAIIAKNKDRIGESVGAFIETHFLTADNIVDKLGRLDLAGTMSSWLRNPANSRDLADALCDLIPPTLATLDDAEVRSFLEKTIASQLGSFDFVVIADRMMTTVFERDRSRMMVSRVLLWVESWVSNNRPLIKAKFGQASRYTPEFLDAYIVDRFVEGIALLLREAAGNPDHPIWRDVDQTIEDWREKLTQSPMLRAQLDAVAREAFATLVHSDIVADLWLYLKREIVSDLSSEDSKIRSRITEGFTRLGAALAEERRVREKLNAWWLAAIENALPRIRPAIGRWVADIIKSWDSEEITRKLETEIGTDLQYIRLNGALVGGLIGLALHAIPL